jgi:hypothetical protein
MKHICKETVKRIVTRIAINLYYFRKQTDVRLMSYFVKLNMMAWFGLIMSSRIDILH